ncbi:MAG: hypothetical protein HKN29_14945 [Rhodothermales bacterium]|nr:hypothetical protein [Rhodothermales bacterium]
MPGERLSGPELIAGSQEIVDRGARGGTSGLSFQYLNDNAPPGNLPTLVRPGPDDYVTTSFWIQYQNRSRWGAHALDATLMVLTNRNQGYRADLLRMSVSRRIPVGRIDWGLGVGVSAMGAFGGHAVQNWYHRLLGVDQIHLDYSREREIKPMVVVMGNTRPWRSIGLEGGFFSRLTQVLGGGPSDFRGGGFVTCCRFRSKSGPRAVRIRGDLAWVSYYSLDNVTRSMFGDGLSKSLALILRVRGAETAVRVSSNEFGRDDVAQFGLLIRMGLGSVPTVFQR